MLLWILKIQLILAEELILLKEKRSLPQTYSFSLRRIKKEAKIISVMDKAESLGVAVVPAESFERLLEQGLDGVLQG